jgi:hypothetical protein
MSNPITQIQTISAKELKRMAMSNKSAAKPETVASRQNKFTYTPFGQVPGVDDKLIKEKITKIGGFALVDSQTVKGKDDIIKMTYACNVVTADKVVISDLNTTKIFTQEEFDKIVKEIDDHISTNNSVLSSVQRLVDKMPKVAPVVDVARYKNVLEQLPLRTMFPDFNEHTRFDLDDEMFSDINPKADAGLPYMSRKSTPNAKCDQLTILEAEAKAHIILDMLNVPDALTNKDSKFRKYMADHPLEFAYRLKRKFERIKRSDFDKKCRVYYVCPFHLKLIFKWVSFHVLSTHQNFLETQNDLNQSISAYKFSWADGGARRIMEFIFSRRVEAQRTQKLILSTICFGDDNLYVLSYPDGTIVVWAPDFETMDLRVPSGVGKLIRANFNRANPHFMSNVAFQNAFILLNTHAFKQVVHINAAIWMMKFYSLISGVPMTTMYNIYASGMAAQDARTQVRALNVGSAPKFSSEGFRKLQSDIASVILKSIGMKIKPDTMQFQVFAPDTQSITAELLLPFLGFTIKTEKLQGSYMSYPVPKDKYAGMVGIALPSSAPDGKKVSLEDLTFARAYGLYFSGYWAYPDVAEFLYTICVRLKASKHLPLVHKLGIDETVSTSAEMASIIALSPLPPSVNMMKLFYTDKALFMEKLKPKIEHITIAPIVEESKPPLVYNYGTMFDVNGIDLDDESLHSELEQPIISFTNADSGVKHITISQVGQLLPQPKSAMSYSLKESQRRKTRTVRKKTKNTSNSTTVVVDDFDIDEKDDDLEESVESKLEREIEELQAKLDQARIDKIMDRDLYDDMKDAVYEDFEEESDDFSLSSNTPGAMSAYERNIHNFIYDDR